MLETAAVYWESKVRIYGFTEGLGLSLFTLIFPGERLENWAEMIKVMAEDHGTFELVFFQEAGKGLLKCCLVFDEKSGNFQRRRIEEAMQNDTATSFHIDFPVELISFHGPHFQDRYGIAEAAFAALKKADFPLLAVGCTGTSVYVVLPEKKAGPAARLLAETFIIPQVDGS